MLVWCQFDHWHGNEVQAANSKGDDPVATCYESDLQSHGRPRVKSIRVLRTRLEELRRAGPTTERTEGILLQVRQLLEKRPYRQDYPTLSFICHCALHSDLRDAAVIYQWLRKLTNSLREVYAGAAPNLVAHAFAGATILDLDRVRQELGEVLRREDMDTLVVDHEQFWHEFARGLLDVLSEKEIGLPDAPRKQFDPAKRYVDDMETTPDLIHVRRIRVISVHPSFLVEMTTSDGSETVFPIYSLRSRTGYSTAGFAATENVRRLMQIDPSRAIRGWTYHLACLETNGCNPLRRRCDGESPRCLRVARNIGVADCSPE